MQILHKKEKIECCKLLKSCVHFDNIEDSGYIFNTLNTIRSYKSILTSEEYNKMDKFIRSTIHPILFDENYFDFLHREDFGEFNEEDGTFHVNSEKSMLMIIYLMYWHCFELEDKVIKFATECFTLNSSELE